MKQLSRELYFYKFKDFLHLEQRGTKWKFFSTGKQVQEACLLGKVPEDEHRRVRLDRHSYLKKMKFKYSKKCLKNV